MGRTLVHAACMLAVLTGSATRASAQGTELTIFGGLAFPFYDERLILTPSTPNIPGVVVTVAGSPVLQADGGPVFGAALALELGVIGIEGRVDVTKVSLDFSGVRYDLRGTAPPFDGFSASLVAAAGRFDADRIPLLSLNARIRTPGPVSFVASGGLSYLPDMRVAGAVPLVVEASGVTIPSLDATLTLRATPEQAGHRIGINGGAGVRLGGRAALVAEVRAFYFRDYRLRFATANGPLLLDELLQDVAPVRFTPVFVNAQAGLTIRF